jgi:hypothetical protein
MCATRLHRYRERPPGSRLPQAQNDTAPTILGDVKPPPRTAALEEKSYSDANKLPRLGHFILSKTLDSGHVEPEISQWLNALHHVEKDPQQGSRCCGSVRSMGLRPINDMLIFI